MSQCSFYVFLKNAIPIQFLIIKWNNTMLARKNGSQLPSSREQFFLACIALYMFFKRMNQFSRVVICPSLCKIIWTCRELWIKSMAFAPLNTSTRVLDNRETIPPILCQHVWKGTQYNSSNIFLNMNYKRRTIKCWMSSPLPLLNFKSAASNVDSELENQL